ncbi:RNA-directed RNA polymerase (Sad-1) [Aspergillus steynii IBT 23096]|uniref:RNA-dependent RNA polymerase n=1 Tax=Aspergillus steynii IBT 23096 TaxID=1392250 RepID=A0A2I2GHR2_9EURO|nr:RNA-directed RNA polymerase (Sad-1) [Aspergillus steynii IBT 23096]PLB52422.1 RNA-directed RNA polymerase (Sad-1) [Aspergillus steynii IBT 23096]
MPPLSRNRQFPLKSPAPRGRGTPAGQARISQPQLPSQIQSLWKSWDSVAIYITNIPKETTTLNIWQAFQKEGNIFSIDLFEDSHGKRETKGKLRFKPPPQTDFWRKGEYTIQLSSGQSCTVTIGLDFKRPDLRIASPVRPNVNYPADLKIPISSMEVGVLLDDKTFQPRRTVGQGPKENAFVVLDLKSRALYIRFQLAVSFSSKPTANQPSEPYQEYRLKIAFVQLTEIHQAADPASGAVTHFTVLDSPPVYHRRITNVASTFIDDNNWREADSWYRQTYIVHRPLDLASLPISLRRGNSLIDIGRWNAFRITFPKESHQKADFTLFQNILTDYNVKISTAGSFTRWDESKEPMPEVWTWIDVSESQTPNDSQSSLEELIDRDYIHLPFPVRYQLEVCLSNGYLSEYSMTRDFVLKLSELGENRAKKLLEHVASKGQVYRDPMKIFDLKFIKGVTDLKIPPYCCHMRSARITPSTIYYNTPTVDISNRIIRHYMEYADRFLRVRFTDEKLLGRINSTTDNTMDEVFTRIKRALSNGIVIGNRHYEFLAFGNSQFREHGAYFFAPLPNITAANIRAWMGYFNNIRNVAKHAARLGQCFSTTRAISGCRVQIRPIDDVERNNYIFSDGVGRISRFLAQMAMSELKIKTSTGEPPSAFQFRLGGCKGMLTVSKEAQNIEVHIRKSQNKFEAIHNKLEIIRWSQYSIATLNRQLIMVLSSLGIPDRIFHDKLKTMVQGLDEALESDTHAVYWLKKYVDPNQMTLITSQMVLDGFRRSKEPFMTSILTLWRAWHLKYLKEKAKIAIDSGASLLGCMDETGILKGYFAHKTPGVDATFEDRVAALPEIFLQISRPENGGKSEVVEGLCILARNPSLHPGDIRVVKAVNIPELSHLHDVVVLPQTGDRDVASMCSGGDLDGDDYLVIWDQDLIPEDWFCAPMKYASNKAQSLDSDVTVDHITSFFVTYMKNDCLPKIAHAHLALADRLEDGVNEEKCIRLAQLHSDAVDYNKTGIPAIMTRNLEPRLWPHFMEKKHKPKDKIYHSNKILGQLYDAIERIDFVPSLGMPFDERILSCQLDVSDDLYEFARELKIQYDGAMRRIMAQHDIKTEFEVWSTFVLSHANMSKDYKFHEEIGGISSSLNEMFRKQCYDKVGGRQFEKLAPLAVAMYRITSQEMSLALQRYREENPQDPNDVLNSVPKINQLPLISFPWVLPHVLGKIATGLYELPAEAGKIHNDPFGLFEDDQVMSAPLRTRPKQENVDADIQSLEELLDFGFSEAPRKSSSSSVLPPAHTNPIDEEISLLDLNNDSRDTRGVENEGARKEEANKGEDKEETEKEKSLGMETPDVPSSGVPDGCIELVEEEGDLEPSALDKLNEILGI